MENRPCSPGQAASSPIPNIQRQRSNSFPMQEALGCSTPEAQLILAEGRAAVRKRRARGRQNRSVNDGDSTRSSLYDPRQHLQYLNSPTEPTIINESNLAHSKSSHARLPSNATDRSTSTIKPQSCEGEPCLDAGPTNTLNNYSANLAEFIKAQLRSIPTYQPEDESMSPLSPRSCPDFIFPTPESLQSSQRPLRRPGDVPKLIDIPPVRPPMQSAFSAWSSTDDDDTDDEAPRLPEHDHYTRTAVFKDSNYTADIGFYATSNSSFLLTSTPADEDGPDTAKAFSFPDQSALPGADCEHSADSHVESYPAAYLSQPQLSISSVPSFSSSSVVSSSSYFDFKQPLSLAPDMKNRIIAALTPPIPHGKVVPAISPWEGGAIANVHDVYVESQQRVRVDGMSFDMIQQFDIPPAGVTTPC